MKKITALVLAMVMVFTLATTVMAFDEDVNKDLAVTRGEFASVLFRIEKALVNNLGSFSCAFTDVEASNEHAEAIGWAAAAGVVKGVSDTAFAPDEYITREQMATMVYRYYQYKGIAPEGAWAIRLDFADAEYISVYAVEGVMFAVLEDMLEADAANNINPQGTVTGDELREVIGNFYFNEIK